MTHLSMHGWPHPLAGPQVLMLAMLAMLLSVQPFMCMLHCAHLEAVQQRAPSSFSFFCGSPGNHTGDVIVAPSASSTIAGAATAIPAYWPGLLPVLAFSVGAVVLATRMLGSSLLQPTGFVELPATPPPRLCFTHNV